VREIWTEVTDRQGDSYILEISLHFVFI